MVYAPAEDSILLRKWVERYAKGYVLDMGTGSGIQAMEATKKAEKVLAVDIDNEALSSARKISETDGNKNIEFRESNLFEKVPEKFDIIIFNPPYLPEDDWEDGIDTTGGKRGNEIIIEFIKESKKHLNERGKVLILFSSLSLPKEILSTIKRNKFKSTLLEKVHYAFEDLFVYLLE